MRRTNENIQSLESNWESIILLSYFSKRIEFNRMRCEMK